jgi:arginine decarboxylase
LYLILDYGGVEEMLPTPKKFFITAASAEGHSKLTAFDNALLKAKIGNVNLLRVSSILPPGCEFDSQLEIPEGSLVPTAYGSIVSDVPGDLISAAVAVGLSENAFGVIMEYSGKCTSEEAEAAITKMVREAFSTRGMNLADIKIAVTEHRVEKIGCAFAAVPLWY